MDLLLTLLAAATLVQTLVIVALVHSQMRTNERWTRAFLDKQGIPLHIMEGEPEAPIRPEASRPPAKHKISIPLPGWRPGGPVSHS
jgi:hypothetical protein